MQVVPNLKNWLSIKSNIKNMKKIRMGLMALAAISGVSSAFAFNHPKKHFGTLYYAKIVSPGHFQWFTSAPGTCGDSTLPNVACTITSTTNVTGAAFQDQLPAGANVQNDSEGGIRQ